MSDFNYYDYLKSNQATNAWLSQMNNTYIQTSGIKIKIFKLDLSKTKFDELYNEENTSRVYVNPFDIRAVFPMNIYKNLVGLEGPYQQEENLQLSVNFENMVKVIRDLKNAHFCDLRIVYTGVGYPSIANDNSSIKIKENNRLIAHIDLIQNDTTEKVRVAINAIPNFSCTMIGKNDLSSNLVSFAETPFFGTNIIVYSLDSTFSTMSDAIEMGDVILTGENRLYEIKSAYPAGKMGWNAQIYILNAELADVDKTILPEPYNSTVYATRD